MIKLPIHGDQPAARRAAGFVVARCMKNLAVAALLASAGFTGHAFAKAHRPGASRTPPPGPTAVDRQPSDHPLPKEIRRQLSPGDVVLAYSAADLTGDGNEDGVLIVRHAGKRPAAHPNPCELIVIERVRKRLKVVGRSANAVDCLDDALAQQAGDLEASLVVAPAEITYRKRLAKGQVRYTFRRSARTGAWYVAQIEDTHPQFDRATGSMQEFKERLSYPGGLPWTALSDFDPEVFQNALDRTRTPLH